MFIAIALTFICIIIIVACLLILDDMESPIKVGGCGSGNGIIYPTRSYEKVDKEEVIKSIEGLTEDEIREKIKGIDEYMVGILKRSHKEEKRYNNRRDRHVLVALSQMHCGSYNKAYEEKKILQAKLDAMLKETNNG